MAFSGRESRVKRSASLKSLRTLCSWPSPWLANRFLPDFFGDGLVGVGPSHTSANSLANRSQSGLEEQRTDRSASSMAVTPEFWTMRKACKQSSAVLPEPNPLARAHRQNRTTARVRLLASARILRKCGQGSTLVFDLLFDFGEDLSRRDYRTQPGVLTPGTGPNQGAP